MSPEVLLVLVPALAVLLLPFLLRRREPWDLETTPERFRELEHAYGRTLQAIQDIDFDFQAGTLSAEEHGRLRTEYKERAVELRRALERMRQAAVRPIALGKRVSLSGDERGKLEALVARARKRIGAR